MFGGDLLDGVLAGLVHRAYGGVGLLVEQSWPSAVARTRARGAPAAVFGVIGASLQLRGCCDRGEELFAARAGAVELIGDAVQPDLARPQDRGDVDEFGRGAREAVQAPYDEDIAWLQVGEQLRALWRGPR